MPYINGTYYPYSDGAEVDLVDQGSVFNVANDTGSQGWYTGKETSSSSGKSGSDYLGDLGRSVGGLARNYSSGGMSGFPEFDEELIEESTKKIDERAADQLAQIRKTFEEMGGLTGISTPDAVQEYYNRFNDYMTAAADRGYQQTFNFDPAGRIQQSTVALTGDVDKALDQYSLMNRTQFKDYALNPPVAQIDPTAITSIADAYLDPKYRDLYSYTDAATQALIKGRPDAIQEQAAFYASSPNVKQMMTYNV